jgi:hypothetical protein
VNECRSPGAELERPFQCTLDMLFNVEKWKMHQLQWREDFFLSSYAPASPPLHSDAKSFANRNALRFGTGRQKEMPLERDESPTFAAYVYASRYGLQSWRGESAGVAKRPRELISHPKSLT